MAQTSKSNANGVDIGVIDEIKKHYGISWTLGVI